MHTVAILAQVSAGWHAGKKAIMCPGVLLPAVSWVGFNKLVKMRGLGCCVIQDRHIVRTREPDGLLRADGSCCCASLIGQCPVIAIQILPHQNLIGRHFCDGIAEHIPDRPDRRHRQGGPPLYPHS